jgi:hypothetical protein
MKCVPPFLMHVSVNCLVSGDQVVDCEPTFRAASWTFGFLFPIRFLSERMASFGWTVFDLMTSEISRFKAMSSLGRLVDDQRRRGRTSWRRWRALSAHPGPSWPSQTSRPWRWRCGEFGDGAVGDEGGARPEGGRGETMAEGGRRQQSRAEQKPAMEQLLGAVVMIKQALETGSRTDWAGAVAHERTVETGTPAWLSQTNCGAASAL